MKSLFLALLLVGCLLLSDCPAQTARSASSADGSGESLTVMTWNLEWFYDDWSGDNYSKLAKEKAAPSRKEWDWRRDAVAACIAETRPTVMALQEIENRRVLWYLTRALARNHKEEYDGLCIESRDHFTEQDVGLLYRPPIDVVSIFQYGYPKRIRGSNQYFDVSKHIMAVFEFPLGGDAYERVIVMNVHLRSRPEGEEFRLRQARLLQHWIGEATRAGSNMIVLGDFNTEERGEKTRKESDLGIASGLETDDPKDDLIDLNLRLPSDQRQTHILEGREFDRIFCSPSLLEDDPAKPDLVFTKIERLRELAVRGNSDLPEEHWDAYWKLPQEERDLSDHYPLMATFEVR